MFESAEWAASCCLFGNGLGQICKIFDKLLQAYLETLGKHGTDGGWAPVRVSPEAKIDFQGLRSAQGHEEEGAGADL